MHQLTGTTKVLLMIVFTVGIITTLDIRLLLLWMVLPVIAIISMKPNYKPILFAFFFQFIMVTLIGGVLGLIVVPDAGKLYVGTETVIVQFTQRHYLTKEWLWYHLVIFVKRTASLATVVAFMLATTPSEFASGLNHIGVPYKVCIIISLAYRTIPETARKFFDIRTSAQLRGIDMSKNVKTMTRIKNNVMILVPLIVSSFGSVESVANALDLRGFGKNKKRTWYSEHELTKLDKILRLVCIPIAAAIIFYIVYKKLYPYPARVWCPFVSPEEILQQLGN